MPGPEVPLFAAAFQCIGRVDMTLALANELTLRPHVPLSIGHLVATLVDVALSRWRDGLDALLRRRDGDFKFVDPAWPTVAVPSNPRAKVTAPTLFRTFMNVSLVIDRLPDRADTIVRSPKRIQVTKRGAWSFWNGGRIRKMRR